MSPQTFPRTSSPSDTGGPTDPLSAVSHPSPYPYYAGLAEGPGIFLDSKNSVWVASRSVVIQEIVSHPACRVRPVAEPVPKALAGSAAGDIFRRLVRMNDGAGHCPFKQAISASLQSLSLADMEQQGSIWSRHLAELHFDAEDDGWLDRFAVQMPVYVVASLLGVPQSELPETAILMQDFVACLAPGCNEQQLERGKLAAAKLLENFSGMQERENPGLLLQLRRQAALLGCEDPTVIAANGIGLMSQAYEATAGLIANTLYVLAGDAPLRRQILADADLLRACIDEVLRYDPSVQNTRRFVAEDCEIAGQVLQAGDTILLVLAAANRDPSVNSQPQLFELQRSQRRYFTFGHGAHLCPGPSLAAVIAHAAIHQLCSMDLNFERLATARKFHPSANIRMRLYGA
ncbi:cytochrome P450 [Undibacterium terreum]|nr:cytochrome P450 [Undibacterium terreum]